MKKLFDIYSRICESSGAYEKEPIHARIYFARIKEDGEEIAFFVDETRHDYRTGEELIGSYMHIGQHGDASIDFVKNDTVPLINPESSKLYKELRDIIGYDIEIVDDFEKNWDRSFKSERIDENSIENLKSWTEKITSKTKGGEIEDWEENNEPEQFAGEWLKNGQIDYSTVLDDDKSGNFIWLVKAWNGDEDFLKVYLVRANDGDEALDRVLDWSAKNDRDGSIAFDRGDAEEFVFDLAVKDGAYHFNRREDGYEFNYDEFGDEDDYMAEMVSDEFYKSFGSDYFVLRKYLYVGQVTDEILDILSSDNNQLSEKMNDEDLIKKVLTFIRKNKTANTTTIRRALGLGYNEVARIMDILEDRGYVGPAEGVGPREILFDISESRQKKKYTLAELKKLARKLNAKDITNISFEDADKYHDRGYSVVATSRGINGMNGAILKLNDKEYLAILQRNTLLAKMV